MAVEGPLKTLDPVHAASGAELLLLSNLVEPLLTIDPVSGRLNPSAAESFKVSEDGLTLTFTLRKELFWSNGEKVVAEDFVYSLRRLLAPAASSWFAGFLKPIRGAQAFHEGALIEEGRLGIRADGERKLIVELEHPDPFLPHVFAQPATAPVHRKTLDRFTTSWFRTENWVGNGPFLPTGKSALTFVLRKNPHHRWAPKIRLDEVQATLVTSAREGAQLFLDGKVDQFGYRDFGVPGSLLPSVIGRKELRFEPDLRTIFLRLNPARAPLSQLKLREAVAMALDRKTLVASVATPGEESTLSLVPQGLRGYEPARGYLYNPPGALGILSDLGFCVRDKSATGCRPFPLMDLIHRDHSSFRKKALALQAILVKTLGIPGLNVLALSDDEFFRRVREGDYLMALDEVGVDPERPFDFLEAFRSAQGSAGGFASKEYDDMVTAAAKSLSWDETAKFLRMAEAHLLQEGVVVPLFRSSTPILLASHVQGWTPNIWGVHPFDLLHW